MKRSASAIWSGGLKDGTGTVSTESGALSSVPYNFKKRFENEKGTNPEELIAAAHAGCFSMAFSAELSKAGHTPTRVATKATVHLGADPAGGMRVSKIELDTEAQVPGIDNAKFQEIAEGARKGCPISKLLTGAPISLTAKLL